MTSVNIDGIGTVQFPDEMSREDILSAIKDNILPKAAKRQLQDTIGRPEIPQAIPRSGPSSLADVSPQPAPQAATSGDDFYQRAERGFDERERWNDLSPDEKVAAFRDPDTRDIARRQVVTDAEIEERTANTPLVNIPAEPFELGVGVPLPQFVKKFSNDFTRRAAERASGFTSPEALTEAASLAPLGAVKYALPLLGAGIGAAELGGAAGEYAGGAPLGTAAADAAVGTAFLAPAGVRGGAAVLRRTPTLREAIRRRMNPVVEPPIEEQFSRARNITPEGPAAPPVEPTPVEPPPKPRGGPSAIQEPSPTEGLLRQERPEMGLSRVEPRPGENQVEAGAKAEGEGSVQPRRVTLEDLPALLKELSPDDHEHIATASTPEMVQKKIAATAVDLGENAIAEKANLSDFPGKTVVQLVNPKTGEKIPAWFDGWTSNKSDAFPDLVKKLAEKHGIFPADFQLTATQAVPSLVVPGKYIRGAIAKGTVNAGSTFLLHGWHIEGLPKPPIQEAPKTPPAPPPAPKEPAPTPNEAETLGVHPDWVENQKKRLAQKPEELRAEMLNSALNSVAEQHIIKRIQAAVGNEKIAVAKTLLRNAGMSEPGGWGWHGTAKGLEIRHGKGSKPTLIPWKDVAKAAEQPAQTPPATPPPRRPRRTQAERPPDIVDDIIGSVGKISQKSWAEAHQSQGANEPFTRRMLTSQVLRNLIVRRGGRDLGQVLTDLHRSGMHQDITNSEQLKGAIEQAMAVRKSKAPAAERKLLDLQERAHVALTSPERGKGQGVADDPKKVSDVSVGDKFTSGKVPMRVESIDEETGSVTFVASGAPQEIVLENDDVIYPDKRSYKKFKPEGGTPFSKIPRPAGDRRSIFDLSDAELEKRFSERAPQPGQFGRQKSIYTFKDLAEFETWMDARYAERDLKSMSEGYRDVDAKFKVGYIKANRGAAAHKQAWISHMATGSPLPAEDPPIEPAQPPPFPPSMGTRPAPKPGGATQPGARGPARPGAPTPPPRQPSDMAPFDIQALVQLLRRFESAPRINKLLKQAYGQYVRGNQLVELKKRLTWDTAFATEVMAHEIGHFVDLAIEAKGTGKEIGARWAALHEFKNSIFSADDVKKAAKALSAAWRGPFGPGDRYRNAATELFADAMSAMLTKPDWVNKNFPLIYDTFQNLLNSKPAFNQAWQDLNATLRVGKMGRDVQEQLDESFRKSVTDFASQEPPEKVSFKDAVRRNFMSKWFRAFDVEGRPRSLADRSIDKLEDNDLMAVRSSALLANRFLRDVQPAINGINPDPEKGRLTLSKWLFANRVIQERRASGQWLEQNPNEAAELLQEILDAVPHLKSKYLGALQNVSSGTQIYDLAGAIFREAHDMGKFTLRRIARIVDKFDPDLNGSLMLEALNVRGKLLNPSGYTPQRAQQLIDAIKSDLTPDQSAALDKAQNAFFDIMQEVVSSAHDLGLISDKMWKELIEPNLRNYVPFAVLEYWDNKVGAGIKPQVGTAKDVADPILAAQLKMGATFNWMQRQMSVMMLIEAYRRGGVDIRPGELLRGHGALEKIRSQHMHDSTSRLALWVDGKQRLVEFPDDPGKTFEQAMDRPSFLKDLQLYTHTPLGRGTRSVLSAYTTLSPAFLFYRNAIRDFHTSAQRVGYKAAIKQTASVNEARRLAYNYAQAAFGGIMDPAVERLVAAGVLPPPQLSRAFYGSPEYLDQMIQGGGLTALQVHPERPHDSNSWIPAWMRENFATRTLREGYHQMERFSAMMEAIPKIQTYYAALKSGLTPEEAQAFARRAGIPNPAIGGKWSGFLEAFMPWTRITVQGHRTTLDILRDQKAGKKFGGRVFTFEILPRIMRYLIAAGVIAAAVKKKEDGEEEEKGWMASLGEHFKRTSPYKAALDNMVPVGYRDPRTKEFTPLYKTFGMSASEIPKHWEAVSFRMPSSEEGKHWGSLVYAILSGTSEQTKIGGKGPVENVGNWATGIMLPGENPAFEIASHQYDLWMKGVNPTDSFRQQPVANPELFKAGGTYRAQANVGALFKETGGPGQLAGTIAQFIGLDPRATDVTKRGAEKAALLTKVPITSAMFSFDNYAPIRDEKEEQAARDKYGTRARMLMTPEVRDLYDYYTTHLQKPAKMDDYQREKFEWAKSWHQQVWGTLNQDGYYYNRAVNAVGPNGSSDQVDTVKRDISEASTVFVDGFNSVKPATASPGVDR